jgi:hypothetical protein
MTTSTTLDSIKKSLVALKMARALEVLDATLRRIEQGEINAIEALDQLLLEEVTLRETRRIKAALMLARLTAIKTLAGFDFAFHLLQWLRSVADGARVSGDSRIK